MNTIRFALTALIVGLILQYARVHIAALQYQGPKLTAFF
jgi:hypothetical protein